VNQLRDIAIIIPVYEASTELRELIGHLIAVGAQIIYVVDDGSRHSSAADVLEGLLDHRVKLCNHERNRGKGRALKTGIEQVIANGTENLKGVITVDADGQHLVADVLKVAEEALADPEKVVVGSRKFAADGVPLRSRFGNALTKLIFKVATGTAVKDTQSGLRFLPADRLETICRMPGERYEFELQMLTELANQGVAIGQPEISTTYVDGNKSSHYSKASDFQIE
jgi:glycosyltransferase involved in cell wall biosynthesis